MPGKNMGQQVFWVKKKKTETDQLINLMHKQHAVIADLV